MFFQDTQVKRAEVTSLSLFLLVLSAFISFIVTFQPLSQNSNNRGNEDNSSQESIQGITNTTVYSTKDTFISLEHPTTNLGTQERAYTLRATIDKPIGTTSVSDIVNATNPQNPSDFNRQMVAYYGFDLSSLGVDNTTHEITAAKLTLYSPHILSTPVNTSVSDQAFYTKNIRVVPDTGWDESGTPLTYNSAIYSYIKGGESGSNQTPVPLTYNEDGFQFSVLFQEEYPVIHSFIPSNGSFPSGTVLCEDFTVQPCPYENYGVTITDEGGYYKLEFDFNSANNNIDELKNLLGDQIVFAIENGRQRNNYGYGFYTKEAAGIPDPQLDLTYEDRSVVATPSGTTIFTAAPTALETDPTSSSYTHVNNPFEQQFGHDSRNDGSGLFTKYQSGTYVPFDGYKRHFIGTFISSAVVNNGGTPVDYSDDTVTFSYDFTELKDDILEAKNRGLKYGFRIRYMSDSSTFTSSIDGVDSTYFPASLHNDPCFIDQGTDLPEWEPLGIVDCASRANLHTLTDDIVDELLAFIASDPDIDFSDLSFVDMVVFGTYGEGSNGGVNTNNYAEYKPYIDAFITKNWNGVQLLMMSDPTVPLAYSVYEFGVINPGNTNKIGLRRDSMGSANRHFSFTFQREHSNIVVTKDLWKTEPFITEFYGIQSSNVAGNKEEHTYRHAMIEAKSMHVSGAQRLRYFKTGANDECSGGGTGCDEYIADPDVAKEMDIFLATMGSKYSINELEAVQCSAPTDPINQLQIYTTLSNFGNVPSYLNWDAVIVFESLSNRYEYPLSSIQLKSLLPTTDPVSEDNFAQLYTDTITLAGVPSDTYSVKIRFYNSKYNTNYRLFNVDGDPGNTPTTGFPSDDGEYLLGTLALDLSGTCSTVITHFPTAVDDTYNVDEDTTLNISLVGDGVLDNDTDTGNLTLTVTGNTSPSSGSLTMNSNGTFTYIPALNFYGIVTFNYTVSNTQSQTDVGTVTITVNSVNDAPIVNAGNNITVYDDALPLLSTTTSASASDLETASGSLTYLWEIISGGAGITLSSPNQLNTIISSGTPGTYTLRLSVSDGTTTSYDTVDVVVIANVAPLITLSSGDLIFVAYNSGLVAPSITDSTFPGSTTLTYNWEIISGSGATILSTSLSSTRVDFTSFGTVLLRITASDGFKSSIKVYEVTSTASTICINEQYSSTQYCVNNVNSSTTTGGGTTGSNTGTGTTSGGGTTGTSSGGTNSSGSSGGTTSGNGGTGSGSENGSTGGANNGSSNTGSGSSTGNNSSGNGSGTSSPDLPDSSGGSPTGSDEVEEIGTLLIIGPLVLIGITALASGFYFLFARRRKEY